MYTSLNHLQKSETYYKYIIFTCIPMYQVYDTQTYWKYVNLSHENKASWHVTIRSSSFMSIRLSVYLCNTRIIISLTVDNLFVDIYVFLTIQFISHTAVSERHFLLLILLSNLKMFTADFCTIIVISCFNVLNFLGSFLLSLGNNKHIWNWSFINKNV